MTSQLRNVVIACSAVFVAIAVAVTMMSRIAMDKEETERQFRERCKDKHKGFTITTTYGLTCVSGDIMELER